MQEIAISELCEKLNGKLEGNSELIITGLEEISNAQKGDLTFIGSNKYATLWKQSKASAAIVQDGIEVKPGRKNRALIFVPSADLAMAEALDFFAMPQPEFGPHIHPTATIDPSAKISDTAFIGAGCFIGPRVVIGDHAICYPNVTIMDDVTIGNHTEIWSGTVIRERCHVGTNCIIHSNVVIGTDGFGFRPSADGKSIVKVTHVGNVVIGNHVEIGAGTCIDRAKFSSTTIGDGSKLDNLIQIGHNVKIGRGTMISAMCGIGGSTTIGDGVLMAGSVAIADHLTIGNGVIIGGRSGVIRDIEDGKKILGYPASGYNQTLKQWAAIRNLPDVLKKLKS